MHRLSLKQTTLTLPRCLIKCFGLLLVTPVLSSTPLIFEGSPLMCCLLSEETLYCESLDPMWTSLRIPQLKRITWILVTQLPYIIMSPIKWDYWLRTLPCSLSTNLVLEAARSCRTSQGLHIPQQSLARGAAAAVKKDELFVKNCTGQHISVMSLLPVRNKPGCKRKPQGTWCSTPQDGCAPQHLWLTVWSTSRKYCVEASRKKANKRRVMLWWLLWAETSC